MDDLIARIDKQINLMSGRGLPLHESQARDLLRECKEALNSQWVSVDDKEISPAAKMLLINIVQKKIDEIPETPEDPYANLMLRELLDEGLTVIKNLPEG